MPHEPLTALGEWSPENYSPFVGDPVAQYLYHLHHGRAPSPFGALLETARGFASALEADPVAWGVVERCYLESLQELRKSLGSLQRSSYHAGVCADERSRKWTRGAINPATGDRMYLRIPGSVRAPSRFQGPKEHPRELVRSVGRALRAGVGFPRVHAIFERGRMEAVYLFGDATALHTAAVEHISTLPRRRGRPANPWTVSLDWDRVEVARRKYAP